MRSGDGLFCIITFSTSGCSIIYFHEYGMGDFWFYPLGKVMHICWIINVNNSGIFKWGTEMFQSKDLVCKDTTSKCRYST